MNGQKRAAAVLAIIEGAILILAAIGIFIFVAVFKNAGADYMDLLVYDRYGDMLENGIIGIMITFGIVALALGVAEVILGAKFCSNKPNKGIAITLIVLSASRAIAGSPFAIAKLILLILYLSKLGKSEVADVAAEQGIGTQNVGSTVGGRSEGAFCGRCGARRGAGDKFCKMCGAAH